MNQTQMSRQRKTPPVTRWGLVLTAIVVVAIVGYVAFDAWTTNNKVANVPNDVQSQDSTTQSKSDEASKTSDDLLAQYKVAADAPRILSIDTINVKARVLPMSINASDSIQAPANSNDAGWYTGSAKPDESGAIFIDGHASGATRMGLFAYLDTLKEGDKVSLEKGDGGILKYKVVHVDIIPLGEIDMKKVLLPYNGVTKGLNLMTCTGAWVPDGKTYDHRVVVYTEQVS